MIINNKKKTKKLHRRPDHDVGHGDEFMEKSEAI